MVSSENELQGPNARSEIATSQPSQELYLTSFFECGFAAPMRGKSDIDAIDNYVAALAEATLQMPLARRCAASL
jgi:hypothetical protein